MLMALAGLLPILGEALAGLLPTLGSAGAAALPAAAETGAVAAGTTAADIAGTAGAATTGSAAATPGAAAAVIPQGMRLSEALGGFGKAAPMFHLASKLVPGKQAKNMLNLMSMAGSGVGNAKDPMALMKSLEGPVTDIAASTQDQGKRLSEFMPRPTTQPAGPVGSPPTPSIMMGGNRLPATRLMGDAAMFRPEDRLRMLQGF